MRNKFQILPEERPLIEAAIKLGDWLWQQESVKKQQKQFIKELQCALSNLPDSTPDVSEVMVSAYVIMKSQLGMG